jgi:glycosyltransferase involved in cell wall biosynthesis
MDTTYVDEIPVAATPVPLAVGGDLPTDTQAVERVDESLAQLDRLANLLSAEDAAPPPVVDYQVPAGFRLSVVIPVYNEEATVLQILARVRAIPLETEIIVVDDASTDRTRSCLEELRGSSGLQLVFKPQNEGKGAALRTGFAAATGDVVVIQDADLEYDPCDIPEVIRPIVEGRADVVYGSRFLGDEPQDPSLLHRLINRALTESSNCFTGLSLTDMETCYKAFRRDVVQDLPLRQNRFGFEPEVTAKLARRGYSVVERPIRYNARGYADGKKIGVRDAFNALYCIVRYGLRD